MRRGRGPGRIPPNQCSNPAQGLLHLHVPHHHERGVVRHVPPAVEPVQVFARHRLQVARPAERRVTIAVGLEGGAGHLGVEQLLGVVVPAVELGQDDGALGLAVVGVVEPIGHPLGLDEEHPVERLARGGLEIGGLVDPGVAVPAAAELLDDALDLVARDVGGPLEVHVLHPVGDAGQAPGFVLRANLVPAPHRRERSCVRLLDEHGEPVVEYRTSKGCGTVPGSDLGRHACIIATGAVPSGTLDASRGAVTYPQRRTLGLRPRWPELCAPVGLRKGTRR